MKTKYLLILAVLLLADQIQALSSAALEEGNAPVIRKDRIEQIVTRVKRTPLGKLPLLAAAGLIGKKALLVGGAVLGAKALVGAGVVGAGLYKAKYYGGGYGGGYVDYHHAPSYVESKWG